MAELETTSTCCGPTVQATCCEPSEKPGCCGTDGGSCGCSAGQQAVAATGVREAVRDHYATAAEAMAESSRTVSLGCGNPTAIAELNRGETVLDLGSGGGIDVLRSAMRVGPTGWAYGLDMTDEMLELARQNQREAGVENVEFVKGAIEDIPLPDGSIDVIISNCVINLSGDKPSVFGEAARVLRPGGRLAVADVVADPDMDEATKRDVAAWTGCIAGALTEEEFRRELAAAGFEQTEIRETHRVHDHAATAIVRACKPEAR